MEKFLFTKKKSILSFLAAHIVSYPTARNLNTLWVFGSLITVGLAYQLLTGVFLAMHYTPNVLLAFSSIEHILRDVQIGNYLKNMHANGASFLFFLLYLHIFRGLYYGTYVSRAVWVSGIILFFLMMAIAFLGYILPWGQMSLWGATVITNLFSALPLLGKVLVDWIWGGYAVDNATLSRFFSIHYCLPFLLLGVIVVHFILLHARGSNNPLYGLIGHDPLSFKPYIIIKDSFFFFGYVWIFIFFSGYIPNILGHSDNAIIANALVTPTHIVPEWYFLPFYAVLRTSEVKLLGVGLMVAAILSLAVFLAVSPYRLQSPHIEIFYKCVSLVFAINFLWLGWCGQQEAIQPFSGWGVLATYIYFFLIILMFYSQMYLGRDLITWNNNIKNREYKPFPENTPLWNKFFHYLYRFTDFIWLTFYKDKEEMVAFLERHNKKEAAAKKKKQQEKDSQSNSNPSSTDNINKDDNKLL